MYGDIPYFLPPCCTGEDVLPTIYRWASDFQRISLERDLFHFIEDYMRFLLAGRGYDIQPPQAVFERRTVLCDKDTAAHIRDFGEDRKETIHEYFKRALGIDCRTDLVRFASEFASELFSMAFSWHNLRLFIIICGELTYIAANKRGEFVDYAYEAVLKSVQEYTIFFAEDFNRIGGFPSFTAFCLDENYE